MAEEAANMRDPFFYRWHAFVDDVFQRHKESAFVRPYSQSEVWIIKHLSQNLILGMDC